MLYFFLAFLKAVVLLSAFVLLFAGVLSWLIVIARRAKLAWANINQVYAGTDTSRRSPSVCYAGVISGSPYLVGSLPCVALDTAANVANGTPTFEFGGGFSLTVTAKSSLSPSTGKAINPGDPIYVDGGTLDTASNITYGFTLDANSGGTLFGYLDPTGPALAINTTALVTVVFERGM